MTVPVDNDPVGVSFRTPNDANPSIWVNHAVTVDATPTAGPSGVGGMNCSADGGTARSYTPSGVTVNGDGVRTVSCTAWNNAVDPQGQPNTGTASMSVHIDEAPPTITFAPQNPADPTGVVVNTSDSESGVASGSIEMAPAGTQNWTSLASGFAGPHLLAHFDDAGLHGAYDFQATACDNVGNCATSTERLALPLRLASDSAVSLTKIIDPLRKRTVREHVRVGGHWVTVRRGHKLVRVQRGGHLKTVKVVKYVERCSRKRVHTRRHGWRVRRICHAPHVHVTKTLLIPHGHKVTLSGLYTTAAGRAAIGPARPNPRRPQEQLRRVHPGRGRHHRTEWQLVRDAAAGSVTNHPGRDRRDSNDPALQRTGHHDRPRGAEAAPRLAATRALGRDRPHRRAAGRGVSPSRWSTGAVADRVRLSPFDLRHPGARER